MNNNVKYDPPKISRSKLESIEDMAKDLNIPLYVLKGLVKREAIPSKFVHKAKDQTYIAHYKFTEWIMENIGSYSNFRNWVKEVRNYE